MKCLIPISQEKKNPNAIRRAQVLCDRIHLLYVVDEGLFERMERESSYVLNSDMLDVLKKSLVDAQRKEAEDIAESAGKNAVLHFEVGDYFEVLDIFGLKLRPDIIMVDSFDRKLISLGPHIWIDRGNELKSAVFVVPSAQNLSRLKKDLELVENICLLVGAELRIYAGGGASIPLVESFKNGSPENADLLSIRRGHMNMIGNIRQIKHHSGSLLIL